MNMNYRGVLLLVLLMLYLQLDITKSSIQIPMIILKNSSKLFNQTTMSPSWKRSNSIEILRKLIANRQILSKHNRTLFVTSKSTSISSKIFSDTTHRTTRTSTSLPKQLTSNTSDIHFLSLRTRSFNQTAPAIALICCLLAFLLLTLTLILLR